MSLAQIPNSTPNEIGSWLVAAAAVAGIVVLLLTGLNQAKQLWTKPVKVSRPASERFVTRAEHERMERELTERLTKATESLGEQLTNHEQYTHTRLHELSQQVHNLGLKIAEQPHDTRGMIDAALAPLSVKVDAMSVSLAAIAAKMGLANPQHQHGAD